MIPSHQLAQFLLSVIDRGFGALGLAKYSRLEEITYVVAVIAVAIFLGWLLRKIVLWALRRWVRFKHTVWGEQLLRAKTMATCCHIIPPLVILACLPIAFDTASAWHTWVMRIVQIYLLVTIGVAVCAAFKFFWTYYDSTANKKHLPLKGIYEVAVGIVWIVIFIISISVILDKSPAMLLGGLGAFAAAMMFVFKDSILGFVAGIQMSNNDMVRVGDWITVPGTPADGVVSDVTITTVKIVNFDNTVVMVPPYSLVTSSFKNWRGMSQSGIRLISRNILIDSASIKTDGDTTNLTKFRAYVLDYLNKHPKLNHTTEGNALTMVRLMPAEATGVPMQLYCFTNTTVWPDYEAIQSEIMEHVIAAASQFGLTVYNYPSSLNPLQN